MGYVQADSPNEAIELFIKAAWHVQAELHEGQEHLSDLDFGELEIMRQVNQGNVCYAPIGEAYATEET